MRSSIAASAAGGSAAGAAAAAAGRASDATAAVDAASQDVGNAVHLEHVNLEVPDLDVARLFYGEGLGLTPDPDSLGWQRGGPFVTWYNIGRQQLHICKGRAAQNTGGAILLKLPHLQLAAERLAALQPVLGGTAFGFTLRHEGRQQPPQGQHTQPDSSGASAGGGGGGGGGPSSSSLCSIEVSDPWGQRFCLVEQAPGFPWPAGIVELQLPCFTGTSHLIARFYSDLLGARVVENGGAGCGGGSGASGCCCVHLGPGSRLRFSEDASLGEVDPQAAEARWSGCHVAFYLAAFGPAFQRVLDLGINQLDHPYQDKAPDVEGALAHHQFRFKDIVHLDAFGKRGGLLHCLGHEVRSLHHPGYMRPLYNRRDY